jgi:transcriptional regulator with XRE-family HTH domain
MSDSVRRVRVSPPSNDVERLVPSTRGVRRTSASLREAAGLNGKELARVLGWAASKVSRLETGKQTPTVSDVTAWARAMGASTDLLDDLLATLRSVRFEYAAWTRRMSQGTATRQHASAGLEAETTLIRAFEPAIVPGLLQTADYARHVLQNVVELRQIPDDVEHGVRLRIQRQQSLYDSSKRFRFLLTEAALRYRPCPTAVLRAQLDRIVMLAELSTVELAVLPFSARLPIAPSNGFWIFDNNLVLVETLSAELSLRDTEDISIYRKIFDRLWEQGLSSAEAMVLISRQVDALGQAAALERATTTDQP